ncbi:MAG: TIGR03809 family protein [Pseudolabrys sp.]
MPVKPGRSFDATSRKWLELAERRLSYYASLYQSGRWRRYYTPESFSERIVDVMKAVAVWRELAGEAPVAEDEARPAA